MVLNYFYDGCSFVGLHLEVSYQSKPKRPRKIVACFYGHLASYFQPRPPKRILLSRWASSLMLGATPLRFGYSRGEVIHDTRCRLAEKFVKTMVVEGVEPSQFCFSDNSLNRGDCCNDQKDGKGTWSRTTLTCFGDTPTNPL